MEFALTPDVFGGVALGRRLAGINVIKRLQSPPTTPTQPLKYARSDTNYATNHVIKTAIKRLHLSYHHIIGIVAYYYTLYILFHTA